MLKKAASKSQSKGFTLLEILLVVGLIAILAGIVILALNPSKNLKETRDSQRRVDVNTILNAVYQYSIDENGNVPASITSSQTEICKSDGVADCSTLIDLADLVTNEKYLVAIPEDPTGAGTDGVGYEIVKTANDRITVAAPDAEIAAKIEVTR